MNTRILGTLVPLLFCAGAIAAAQPAPVPAIVYNLKMGSGRTSDMNVSLTFTVKSTGTDGTRNASLLVNAPQMPPMNGKQMDAAISPAGAITIDLAKTDSQMPMGATLQMLIDPLNAFAAACGAAPSLKEGTAWHAFWSEGQSEALYTVTGHAQHAGHESAIVTVNSLSNSGPAMTGRGSYDPISHLVVSLHSEVKESAQGGVSEVLDANIADAP